MRKLVGFIISALALYASPALADEVYGVTPSGSPEVVFTSPPEVTIGKLSSSCISQHFKVISSTATQLVCEAPMSFGQSLLGTLLMGNSYSTPPRTFYRFNIADVDGLSRVQGSGWMELQMAFGQVRRTDFDNPGFFNGIMGFMINAGGHFPNGTTFPNHISLGVKGEFKPEGQGAAMIVKEVLPGSAAEKAGILPGDKIIRIAKKKFKNDNQFLDAAAKAAKTATFPVELIRDGKTMTVTADREFRAPISEHLVADASPPPGTAPVTAAAPASVADQLAKLAELHKSGALTDAEYSEAKAKILAQ